MCGIAGIWNFRTGTTADRDTLTRITGAISHRGPDGEGFYWGPGPGLGHRRLSIIDLEGGRQPMCNEDGTVWIVFNGEIYNYPELRQKLLQRGHRFQTHSDTEAIVHLYEDFGDKCFEHLRGMFALAIWDQKAQKLVLGRDRLGIKPLIYAVGHQGIVFGSELKCVRDSGVVELEVDETSIVDLFTWFYIPGPKTIYKDVFTLEPGHSLTVTVNGIQKSRYWDFAGSTLELETEAQYEDRLLEVLEDSVRCHLLSDVPIGAFLSGGVDSSIVVGLMSKLMTRPVETFSIGFPEEAYNELPRARRMAELFHTEHHERVVNPEPAKLLEQLTHYYDEPFPDHSSLPTYYVSKLAREKVKVVLSGDGGDENFGGYSRYLRHETLHRIRQSVPSVLMRPFAWWSGDRRRGDLLTRLHRNAYQVASSPRDGYLHAMTIADENLRRILLSNEVLERARGYDPHDRFREIYDRAPKSDFLSKIFYLDLKTYLVDDILTKVDRASMANSLEVRVPILDHRVVEFAHSVPAALKLKEGRGKHVLRQAMSRIVPSEHLSLPKKGFCLPMANWMKGELRGWTEGALFSNTSASEYLNINGVRAVWTDFVRGGAHLADVTGILLSFTLSSGLWGHSSKRENTLAQA